MKFKTIASIALFTQLCLLPGQRSEAQLRNAVANASSRAGSATQRASSAAKRAGAATRKALFNKKLSDGSLRTTPSANDRSILQPSRSQNVANIFKRVGNAKVTGEKTDLALKVILGSELVSTAAMTAASLSPSSQETMISLFSVAFTSSVALDRSRPKKNATAELSEGVTTVSTTAKASNDE